MEAQAGIAAWRTFLRRKELPRGRRSKEQKKKKKKKNRDPSKDNRTSIADCKRSLTFLHPKKQKLLQLILPSKQEVLKKKATSMHNLQQ
jgi:hypothetical protein